jgi:ubiquinone/menaquinone biosynthesis C-methylase UbiE
MADESKGFLHPEEIVRQLNIKKWMKIADFGCGSGYFSLSLAKRLGHEGRVYAFDILEAALESVRSRAKIQGLFNIETLRCNLERAKSTTLKDEFVDLTLLSNILFQSAKKADIIKEGTRILKPGGELVIIDWRPNQPVGPTKEFVVPLEKIKQLVESQGLRFKRSLMAGKYHWGLVFEK